MREWLPKYSIRVLVMLHRRPWGGVVTGGLLLAVIMLGRNALRPTLEPMQPNFGFVFEYGACGVPDRLDTFDGTFTKSVSFPPHPHPGRTVRVLLSKAELSHIYEEMARIDLLGYPDTFTVHVPFWWPFSPPVETVTPAMTYRFVVRNGGLTKHVFWVDNVIQPPNEQAQRLRTLVAQIQHTLGTHAVVKHLPQPQFGCL